jgi:hypothetical protein
LEATLRHGDEILLNSDLFGFSERITYESDANGAFRLAIRMLPIAHTFAVNLNEGITFPALPFGGSRAQSLATISIPLIHSLFADSY